MRKLITLIALVGLFAACTDEKGHSDLASFKTYDTEAEAQDASPVGHACLYSGSVRTVCVPDNRGKNGNCTDKEVDDRIWTAGYLVGDVNNNGIAFEKRGDADLATKRIYVKQIESQPCPAQADIAKFEGVEGRGDYILGADGFLTSNDINAWRDVFQTEQAPFEPYVICADKCAIVNHMKK